MNINNPSYQYLKQSNPVRITLSCWKSHFMFEFFNEDFVSSDFLLEHFSFGFRYVRSFYFARRHQLMEHQFGERSKKHRPELTAATILLIRSNGRGRNISFFLLILWNRTWESMMLRGARSPAGVGRWGVDWDLCGWVSIHIGGAKVLASEEATFEKSLSIGGS